MLKFYNTLTRKKESFKLITGNNVKIYSCGPTVYSYVHIGNLRAFLFADLLRRYLKFKGFKLTHVMNITDVDDKIIKNSQKENKTLKEFTEKYTKAFFEDLQSLNLERLEYYPKATAHINEMVDIIQELLNKGIAYKTDDGIYYNIKKFKDYGKLANIKINSQTTQERIKNDEYDKENLRDFALWKFWDKEDGNVFWSTKIGKGRPGWHVECSAMSMKYLGKTFDIHTGGIDLVFPHHQNEIAQSEGATNKKFVNYWLHNEHLLVDNQKMSKSLGNFYTLRDIQAKGYKNEAIRYLLISTHYRQKLNFTFKGLEATQNAIERINEFIRNLQEVKNGKKEIKTEKYKKQFEKAMDDDLNISAALAVIFELIKNTNKVIDKLSSKSAKEILKLLNEFNNVLEVMSFKQNQIPKEIIELVGQREEARKSKDWKKADILRERIKSLGYQIDDKTEGALVKKI